ncbi:hypothetical protein [Micromonospora deserti]|uniref:Uncharacterized protein n=1 Tax=Micromonospora deserti TaxID=2070366 RepID=A0A2W2DM96_9ACTN|nr:hypothetical protein [Micromonospora deserti]PZG00858.1 hypothetical protein C1I99_08905 [Micromonospora deserti]
MDERERKRLYVEARIAEVAAANSDLQVHIEELDNLLAATLDVDDHIDFGRLKKTVTHPPFNPEHAEVKARIDPSELD